MVLPSRFLLSTVLVTTGTLGISDFPVRLYCEHDKEGYPSRVVVEGAQRDPYPDHDAMWTVGIGWLRMSYDLHTRLR